MDDRRVVSGIVHVIRNGLRWRGVPAVYGPHKTLYNRFVRWSRMGIFDRIFANLAAESGPPRVVLAPVAGAKLVEILRADPVGKALNPPMTVPRRIRRRGEEETVKTIACGNAG
jgi:putative transposase